MYTKGYGAPGTVEPVMVAPVLVDVVEAEVDWGNMKPLLVDVEPAPVPTRDPVQLALVGQHAILLAASRVQVVPP